MAASITCRVVIPSLCMPTPTTIIALFAAGPGLWEYPKWQERTRYEIPPFSSDATPQLTKLTGDQLSAVKALAAKVFAQPTTHQQILNDLAEERNNDSGGREAWTNWAKARINEWNVIQDVEALLMQESRHPRQLINQQDFVSARAF